MLYRKRSGGTALEERIESHRPERFRYSTRTYREPIGNRYPVICGNAAEYGGEYL